MKRKLGIISDCMRGQDPVETLDKIKEIGFDSFFTGRIDVETVSKLRNKGDKLGLDFEFIHAPFKDINNMWLKDDSYQEINNGMITTIDSASACNVPVIIAHLSSGWDAPPITEVGLERYDRLIDYAANKNVIIAFENLRKVGNLAYFVDKYEGNEFVKFCYDNGHEHCYTKTVCWPDIFTHNIIATHIHDNMGRGWEKTGDPDTHLLPFDGNFDFVKMMRKLDEYNFAGTLMLEVFNHSVYSEMTTEEFITTCYERIKKISEM